MDVLSDLRKYGLISTPAANEAYMPPDENDQDAQDQSAASKDAQDDTDQDQQDQEMTPQEQEDMIQVPVEIKDQVLQLHKLAGEIYGAMIGDEENMKDKYTKFENKNPQAPALMEEVDVGSVINELITTSWGGDNASQGKAVELLKGLAFSDDPKANAFMQKLDAFTSGLDPKEFGA